MSLEKTNTRILSFCKVRSWDPSLDGIAKSIVIESAELLERFQWSDKFDKDYRNDLVAVSNEIADVYWYLVLICNKLNINFTKAINEKIDSNEIKFPESEFKNGHNEKFYRIRKAEYRK